MALPHGPQKYSHTMPGLVETSCNVASVKCDKETSTYRIQTSSRSSIGGALERLRDQIKTIGDLCGATTATDEVINDLQSHLHVITIQAIFFKDDPWHFLNLAVVLLSLHYHVLLNGS